MGVIGTFAADGSIENEVDVCAVTGNPVLGHHSTRIHLDKTHYVRVLSAYKHLWTPEREAQCRAMIPPPEITIVSSGEPTSTKRGKSKE